MGWDYHNDSEPGESYSEFIDRKKTEESSNRLFIIVFSFIFHVARALVVYSPLFYIGYTLASKLDVINQISLYLFMLLFAYLLYSFIFFLKGLLVGLKHKRNGLWILLWVFCVIATCLVPAMIAEEFLKTFFKPDTRMLFKNQVVMWVGSLLFGLYVYHCYQFKTASAPKAVWWSYSLGFGMV